ncbi:uncharacterized protein LOC113278919 [Papaver somniferum]|uniref:uncharacterized protein LOC113278919 n=1 Tax=Papaver somniferum TaxID=3469 RepID=UPI000E6F5DD0|nr:uncharacterized protein LOC113278919 [Papaver somniferum]
MQNTIHDACKDRIIIWHIWKAKCSLVFENVQLNIWSIANRIGNSYNDWKSSCLSTVRNNIVNGRPIASSKPHIDNELKINFDATFIIETGNAGLGLIIRDFAGTQHGLRSRNTPSVNAAGAEAAHMALCWAKKGASREFCWRDIVNVK